MKMFTSWRREEVCPLGSSTSPGMGSMKDRGPGYHIQNEDLGKVHKAASKGNLWRVRQILFFQINGLDETDKMNRTALHWACARGHPGVVALLVDRKCLLDVCDKEKRTALTKAIQCQQEECVAILLNHGADPNVADIDGNTALHHAVLGQSPAIVAKLLSHNADTDVRNKDDLTPLSLAKSEKKKKMVELLLNRGAEVNQMESSHQLNSEYKEERYEKSFESLVLQEFPKQESRKAKSRTVNKSSEEISFSRSKSNDKDCKKKSQESEINRERGGGDISADSGCPSVQKDEEMLNKQGKVEQCNKLQLVKNKKFGKTCEKYKSTAGSEEESLHGDTKEEASLRQIPSHLIQKPLYAGSHGASSCKRMEIELQDASSSPRHSDRSPKVSEELQQEMQWLKNDMEMLKVELLALKKEKVQLQKENDDVAKLKTAYSRCLHMDAKNKYLQQKLISLKAVQEKCENLENENKKLKQEVVDLKRHMEMNMVAYSEVEQYKRKIEERARQDIENKSEQVNQLLQIHGTSQENSEYHNAAIRQLEARNKDLESELSKMKTRNQDLEFDLISMKVSHYCNKIEFGKYKQLYLDEVRGRKLLENELNNSISTPGEDLVIPTSSARTSYNSMTTSLIMMQREFKEILTGELEEGAAKFVSESYGANSVGSINQSNSSEDAHF